MTGGAPEDRTPLGGGPKVPSSLVPWSFPSGEPIMRPAVILTGPLGVSASHPRASGACGLWCNGPHPPQERGGGAATGVLDTTPTPGASGLGPPILAEGEPSEDLVGRLSRRGLASLVSSASGAFSRRFASWLFVEQLSAV
jgi:hypothetical protein